MNPSLLNAAIISSILPKLKNLGKDMHRELVVETPFETGELRDSAYAALDPLTGELEVGYDETGSPRPHGYFVVYGTSEHPPNPVIQRVVYRKRRPR